MSSAIGGKPRSLVEQKRLQWARERDEMANLCAPWGKRNYERYSNKSYPSDYYYHQKNSLPPLRDSSKPHETYPPDQGGETSGYASDCAPQGTPDIWSRRRSTGLIWSRDTARTGSPDSVSTAGERLKWGDRGVGVGHLWEPNEVDQRPPLLPGDGSPPGWLQRGLKNDSEIMVINHGSEKESSEDTESSSGAKTYLRGQNIPLDAAIIAERERKRQQALEHQQAICQQLEEREQRRRAEKERRQQEERLEEERIRREQELERQRMLREEQMAQERIERERKRQEAMKQALEDAERAAKLEKQRKRQAKLHQLNENELLENKHSPRNLNTFQEYPDIVKPLMKEQREPEKQLSESKKKVDNYSNRNEINENDDEPSTVIKSPRNVSSEDSNKTVSKQQPSDIFHQTDGLALILQSTPYQTVDTGSLSNIQFALLMTPQSGISNNTPQPVSIPPIPIAIPLSGRSTTVGTNTESVTENRVLTPTKYRQRSNCRDASTQTERLEIQTEVIVRPKEYKYGSLDRQIVNKNRRERRQRSEERALNSDRPKWGVNKPPKQYLTQSEKDPVYQRRKLRQKLREVKVNDDKNNIESTDDSRSPSPINNNSKNMSRRRERMLLQNLSVYQTEIVPIEADAKGRLYVGQKPLTTRRQSISEKFFIAKQQRARNEEFDSNGDSRKHRLNKQNENKRLSNDEDNTTFWESAEILNQLSNLKNNLLQKQRNWDNVSSSRSDPLDIDTDVI